MSARKLSSAAQLYLSKVAQYDEDRSPGNDVIDNFPMQKEQTLFNNEVSVFSDRFLDHSVSSSKSKDSVSFIPRNAKFCVDASVVNISKQADDYDPPIPSHHVESPLPFSSYKQAMEDWKSDISQSSLSYLRNEAKSHTSGEIEEPKLNCLENSLQSFHQSSVSVNENSIFPRFNTGSLFGAKSEMFLETTSSEIFDNKFRKLGSVTSKLSINDYNNWSRLDITSHYNYNLDDSNAVLPEAESIIESIIDEEASQDSAFAEISHDSFVSRTSGELLQVRRTQKLLDVRQADTSCSWENVRVTLSDHIDDFYSKQRTIDWNKEAQVLIKKWNTQHVYEPNLEYIESKLIQDEPANEVSFSSGCAEDEIEWRELEDEETNNSFGRNENRFAADEIAGNLENFCEVNIITRSMAKVTELKRTEKLLDISQSEQIGESGHVPCLDDYASGPCQLEQNWLMHYLDVENPVFTNRKNEILKKIQELAFSLMECAASGKPMKLKFQNNSKWANCTMENDALIMRPTTTATKTVNFMVKSSERRFAVMIHVIGEIFKLLSMNSTCTKREIYYRDVEFLQRQEDVDRTLNDICLILDAKPWELGIIATSKGLVAGNLKIVFDDRTMDFANGGSVPNDISAISSFQTEASYILVVEKDTVYQRLLDGGILEKLGSQIILITAKGYPDINTRLLLKKLYDSFKISIYVLVDADPHGIEIMFTYRFGSLAMSHLADSLAVPNIKWLGIYPSEIESLTTSKIALTKTDLKKLKEMIGRKYIDEFLKSELNVLLKNKVKAEIEGISDVSLSFLINDYIPGKIRRNVKNFL